jgi:hypothetical protein
MNTIACLIAFFAGVGVCTTGFALGIGLVRLTFWLIERKTKSVE